MKIQKFRLYFFLCLLLTVQPLFPQVVNLTDTDSFKQTVKSAKKPIIVKFFAEWCGACNMVKEPYAQIADELNHILFAEVDVDNNNELTQEYDISAMPTFVYIQNGDVKEKERGAHPNFKEHLKTKALSLFPSGKVEPTQPSIEQKQEPAGTPEPSIINKIISFIGSIFTGIRNLLSTIVQAITGIFK